MSEEINYKNIEKIRKIKDFCMKHTKNLKKNKEKILLFTQFSLVALIFFMLGVIYTDNKIQNQIKKVELIKNQQILGSVNRFQKQIQELEYSNTNKTQIKKENNKFLFVASKNGKTYYKISCKNRIKKENKIYFKTEEDAKKTGLRRSKSCFK